MKTLTVITTTYNRAYCLPQLYESLLRQSSKDFIWMIIDDGSTDNTAALIKEWENEKIIDIEYYYKENGGMHTARNMAYEKCNTILNVIIDSDDWMTDDAIELIISYWNKFGNEKYYGIVANNIDTKGNLIGNEMPKGVKEATSMELFGKYRVKGDKKFILRSELSKRYSYPEFEGEKFYPASYKYKLLDQHYKLLILSKAICVVDYNPDSMTYNKIAQYRTCSRGFAHYRNEMIRISKSPIYIFKESIHYVAESLLSGEKQYIRKSSKPVYVIAALPWGKLYFFYLKTTKRKY